MVNNVHHLLPPDWSLATALHTAETKAFRGDARRSPPDAAFLAELAERLAVTARLPLATAKARVQAVAVSAGAPLDGGGDAR